MHHLLSRLRLLSTSASSHSSPTLYPYLLFACLSPLRLSLTLRHFRYGMAKMQRLGTDLANERTLLAWIRTM